MSHSKLAQDENMRGQSRGRGCWVDFEASFQRFF